MGCTVSFVYFACFMLLRQEARKFLTCTKKLWRNKDMMKNNFRSFVWLDDNFICPVYRFMNQFLLHCMLLNIVWWLQKGSGGWIFFDAKIICLGLDLTSAALTLLKFKTVTFITLHFSGFVTCSLYTFGFANFYLKSMALEY